MYYTTDPRAHVLPMLTPPGAVVFGYQVPGYQVGVPFEAVVSVTTLEANEPELQLCQICREPLQPERMELPEPLVHSFFCWHCIQYEPIEHRLDVCHKIRLLMWYGGGMLPGERAHQ